MNAFFRIALEFLAALRHLSVLRHDNLVGRDRGDFAAIDRKHDRMRIPRDLAFQAGADQWRFINNQRYALALHVRAHQSAVSIVMLQERN